jgi:hypothetical protein
VVRSDWYQAMRSKAVVLVGLAGLFGVSLAFILGIVVGSSNAQVSLIRETPAPYCFEDPNPDQFTEQHVETKVIACQVMGMTKAAAIAYIEGSGRSYRIAFEDGESFALTQDYRDDRINLELILGLVVGADSW